MRGHIFFCLSFPLLLLKFKLRVVEPHMHTVQGHSGSTHKTRNVVFVGEMLPSLRRRTYLGNKALLVAFWFWKFRFHCGNLFDCTLYGTLGHCGMIMQSLLMSSPVVLPTDLHTFALYVFILMCTTSSKLPCQGTDRNMHQA